jgi:hypothetical protein
MLRGQLTDFPLTEVARLLSATSKTGCLHLRTESVNATIFLNLGQIQSAVCNEHTGLDALELISAQIEGEFEFEEGVTSDHSTLSSLPTPKLLEVLERINLDVRELATLRPNPLDCPRYLSGHVPPDFEASTQDLALALSSRGSLSVAELAEQNGLPLPQAIHAFARFRRAGFIEIVGRKEVPGKPSPVAEKTPAPPTPTETSPVRTWRGRPIK